MSTSNSNSHAILEVCQKRLSANDKSLQTSVRFSALATAFLGSSTPGEEGQIYGNVRVIGGERYNRKGALIYFLMRLAEKGKGSTKIQSNENQKVYYNVFKYKYSFKYTFKYIFTCRHCLK